MLGKAIRQALSEVPLLPEWQDQQWLARHKLPPFHEALSQLHVPESVSVLAPDNPARMRLAYDELLANQLALSLVRGPSSAARSRRGY